MEEQRDNEQPKKHIQTLIPQAQQKPTRAQIKAKRKSLFNKIVAVLIFIFMVGWVFVYYVLPDNANQNQENMISVGGYSFYTLPDGTFGTYINIGNKKMPVAFRLDPRNASSIDIDPSAVQQILTANKVYITSDPLVEDKAKVAIAAAEISRITALYNIETIGAFVRDSEPPNPNVPIRTCNDVSDFTTVIELIVSNETARGINNVAGCIKISAESPDTLIDVADKLGMNLLGIKL